MVGQGEAEMRCQDWGVDREREAGVGGEKERETQAPWRLQDPSSSWDERFRHPLSIFQE